MSILRISLLTSVTTALFLQSCGDSRPGQGLPANVGGVTTVSERSGRVAAFGWRRGDGVEQTFDSYRGKLTLINFWATWCGPCKGELPDIVELSREFAGRDVKVLGISTDRTPNAGELVSNFIRDYQIPYPVVISNDDLEEAFGNVRLLPTTFLVDADGRILESFVGMRTKAQFEEAITRHLVNSETPS